MRFISLPENFKKSLNIVSHLTSKNINLPILNNILIKAEGGNIELISTNLEIGITKQIRGKLEKEGSITVDSKLITEYVNLLGGDSKVLIEEKEGELAVESGNYKTKIKGEPAKDFPLIPTIPKDNYYHCQTEDLRKALNSVGFAVSNSENRIELSGVLFSFTKGMLSLAATDSYRLAEKEIEIEESGSLPEECRVIVPAKTVQELLRVLNSFEGEEGEDNGTVNIYLSDNQILFTVDSVELISRLINGHYPDYKQIIPTKNRTKILAERSEMVRAVKAAALFSKTGINDINLQFTKNKVIVSASSGASGESRIEVEADNQGEANEITINYRYLLDGLNNISESRVSLAVLDNNSPCVIRPEKDQKYLYIIMPIKQ